MQDGESKGDGREAQGSAGFGQDGFQEGELTEQSLKGWKSVSWVKEGNRGSSDREE